jgi:hypothetical protein
MKSKILLIILFIVSIFGIDKSFAQIENVIVETYYVSDTNDATDTSGGYLEPGSTTYRIYVDLAQGTKIRKIYGDASHALKISSTEHFFNNKADGQTFGKDFSKNRLGEGTVALDSWITLGQTTRTSAKTYFGVLKSSDSNGSFIGGSNNDGGSAAVAGGLIANNNNNAGIPVTDSDGMDSMTVVPSSWADYGIIDLITGDDTTIFGYSRVGNEFSSNDAGLQNSGVSGKDPYTNLVLVAQLTTKGTIKFELNLEVEEPFNGNTQIVKYVADGTTLGLGERLCPALKYPAQCGCKDPAYAEYNAAFGCHTQDSCHSLVVYGCMDSLACNYDPAVNFNLPELCCYPGYCNDRDIEVICPQLSVERKKFEHAQLYPNPASDQIIIEGIKITDQVNYYVYDRSGKMMITNVINSNNQIIDISGLSNGIYMVSMQSGGEISNKIIIKQKN